MAAWCLRPCRVAGLNGKTAACICRDKKQSPHTCPCFSLTGAYNMPFSPRCTSVARPNMLLFGDPDWHDVRAERQTAECHTWLNDCAAARQRLVIFEIGAGDTVPTSQMDKTTGEIKPKTVVSAGRTVRVSPLRSFPFL